MKDTCDRCDMRPYIHTQWGDELLSFCKVHYEEWEAEVKADRLANPIPGEGAEHRCPRRDEDPDFFPGPDRWSQGHGIITDKRVLACSYCGSLHPDTFMEAVDEGHEIGPTDKSYKVYVRDPGGRQYAKFYFQHLSPEQRREFIARLNAQTMNIGYPGHFYRLPFFVRVENPAET